MYIIPPLKLTKEIFVSLLNVFVKKILMKWTNANIQIVAQISKANVWNKDNQKMKQMYNVIEKLMNILSHVNFSKLCNIMHNFPESNHNFVKDGITFPLS